MIDVAEIAIDTARLHLRALAEGDETLYCELFTDPTTMKFIGLAWSQERAARSFRNTLAGMAQLPFHLLMLTIVEKAKQQSVGFCALQNVDPSQRTGDLGLMMAAPFRAQRLGMEAVVAQISWIFATLPINKLRLLTSSKNLAAVRMAVHMGFLRRDVRQEDDSGIQIWSVLRESWPSSMGRVAAMPQE